MSTSPIPPFGVIASASNLCRGDNPAYTQAEFFAFYPQFQGVIPEAVLGQFIAMANAVVNQSRWRSHWAFGMANYVAHFSTLYLQTLEGTEDTAAANVITAAQAIGLQVSESAGGLSSSVDFSHIMKDLEGWAMFNTTAFGQQFVTMAKRLGKAPILVW